MKRVLISLALAVMPLVAFAQGSLLKPTFEIVSVEVNDVKVSVFDMPEEDQHQYFIDLGTLGFGDDFIQVHLDPLSQLFIPLGNTVDEVMARLEEFSELPKSPEGTQIQTQGVLAIGNPTMGESETVYVTSRKFLFDRIAEFSVKRDGCIRATHISRSNLKSLLSGVKFYSKLFPDN